MKTSTVVFLVATPIALIAIAAAMIRNHHIRMDEDYARRLATAKALHAEERERLGSIYRNVSTACENAIRQSSSEANMLTVRDLAGQRRWKAPGHNYLKQHDTDSFWVANLEEWEAGSGYRLPFLVTTPRGQDRGIGCLVTQDAAVQDVFRWHELEVAFRDALESPRCQRGMNGSPRDCAADSFRLD